MENPFKVIKRISQTNASIGETDIKCDKHPKLNKFKNSNGEIFCPKCFLEKETENISKKLSDEFEYDTFKGYLLKASILDDTTILESRIELYQTHCSETKFAKEKALELISEWGQGGQGSLLLVGNVGVGKSHLSYAILHELNKMNWKKRCMFVSVEKLFRLLIESIKNKNNLYTEESVIKQLSEVDFLVLDDLGAETGNADTDKKASEFKSRVLGAIYSARQKKPTITTTNLVGKQVASMYDKRMSDRLINHNYIIKFVNAKSMRKPLPF